MTSPKTSAQGPYSLMAPLFAGGKAPERPVEDYWGDWGEIPNDDLETRKAHENALSYLETLGLWGAPGPSAGANADGQYADGNYAKSIQFYGDQVPHLSDELLKAAHVNRSDFPGEKVK